MVSEPLPQEFQDEHDTMNQQDYGSNRGNNRHRLARSRTFQCHLRGHANSMTIAMEKSKVFFMDLRTVPGNDLLTKLERLIRKAG